MLVDNITFCLRHVLELGGGQTGVCGLGLAMATVPTSSAGRESLCKSVTITDGHPLSVANQVGCFAVICFYLMSFLVF